MEQNNLKKEKGTSLSIDINVTKIVKYVCMTGIIIVACIFGEKAFHDYMQKQ